MDALLEDPSTLATTGLVVCEVLQGIRTDAEGARVERSLLSLTLLPEPSLGTYRRAAELFRVARRRGRTIRSTIDCILAAQCIEADVEILHGDRDFDRIAAIAPLRIHPSSPHPPGPRRR
ncbi:Ribonuclease VapC11 [Myxococcaceae bacterium]|nr:Ribonuclease VapC11 [Myxococcaceae bacterium]